jgi:hypothetical protein
MIPEPEIRRALATLRRSVPATLACDDKATFTTVSIQMDVLKFVLGIEGSKLGALLDTIHGVEVQYPHDAEQRDRIMDELEAGR